MIVADERTTDKRGTTEGLFQAPFYAYHQLTKHTVAKLMSHHHHLDWANQPDPFRRYETSRRLELPRSLEPAAIAYYPALEAMLVGQGTERHCNLPDPQAADAVFLSRLLFYSMAISAWKEVSGGLDRWSVRVNPSSGNLHPTETHLLLHSFQGLEPGAYHYYVRTHALEQRAAGAVAHRIWEPLTGSATAPPAVVCLTSIFWRESWKYRDRGYRYCQHDMGHAMAAVALSAAVLGWRAYILGEFPDRDASRLIGLSDIDEKPSLFIGLYPGLKPPAEKRSSCPDADLWSAEEGAFFGTPNALSSEQVGYPSIDRVYQATCLTRQSWRARFGRHLPPAGQRPSNIEPCAVGTACVYKPELALPGKSVHWVVRTRRSAVDLDGHQRMSQAELGTLLVSATRGFAADFQRPAPFNPRSSYAQKGHHLIHLYLYVHRIDGLEPGLYYFDRNEQELVPLVYADEREAAKYASCFQDIAADGCFAVSMIADFNIAYQLYGDRGYRYVHFEAGWIGQWLYLGSTALGYEATGIGCFLDDLVNNLMGLPPGMECIYNFTVGRAVLDPRLTTLPAYDFPDPALAS